MSKLYEEYQEYDELARKILEEIGAITYCKSGCGTYCDNGLEEKYVYGLATNKLKSIKGENANFDLFHSRINELLKEGMLDSRCPYCGFKFNE